jgi:hypothetical protein
LHQSVVGAVTKKLFQGSIVFGITRAMAGLSSSILNLIRINVLGGHPK